MALISLTIAAGLALAVAPAGDEPLQPSTGWNVDYAETNCTLSRSYGTGADTLSLGFIPATGGARMRVVLLAKDPKRLIGNGLGSIRFDAGKPDRVIYYTLVEGDNRIGLIRSTREQMAPLATAKTMTLTMGPRTVRLAVPQMAAALKALEACESDLAAGWGFDMTKIGKAPESIDPQSWVGPNDYPSRELDAGAGGETGIRVTVDPTGKPTDCTVIERSGVEALDKRACEIIMARGKYRPGLDKEGKPMIGLVATSFVWLSPGAGLIM